ISKEGEIMALGEKMGILSKMGNSYKYTPKNGEEIALGRGYDATRQFLKDNKKISDEILGKIKKFMNEEGFDAVPAPNELVEEKPEE
ncbi:MAG: recombinase RecA, partial [Patescibacteria group bacterium]